MNKVSLPSFLALLLILFLSLAVVSANDEFSSNVTFTEDSMIDGSDGISACSNSLDSNAAGNSNLALSNYNDSDLTINSNEIDDSNLEDSIASGSSQLKSESAIDSDNEDSKNADKKDILSSQMDDSQNDISQKDSSQENNQDDSIEISNIEIINNLDIEKAKLSAGNTIVITDSTYSKYFDLSKNGTIIEGKLHDGDILKIGNVSNKIFTINKQLTLIPEGDSYMKNCLIRLVDGSRGTLIRDIRINNTNEKVRNYYLAGIHMVNTAGNRLINISVSTSKHCCYGIIMSNASHNEIINSTFNIMNGTAIPMTGSSYNTFRGNHFRTYNSNMIYYSMYGNGDFMPLDELEKSHDNIIANNYFTSVNGMYDSYCYAVQLMEEAGGSNTIVANNTFDNVFRAISVYTPNTLLINNTISNVGGEAAIILGGINDTAISNNVSTTKAAVVQWNPSGEVVGILIEGANAKVINNTIKTIGSNGIKSTGINSLIVGNDIYTESSSCINLTKSNARVENNTIVGVNSSAVKVFTSKLVENTTVRNNDISTNTEAIVLQGKVNYSLVCDNRINVSEDGNGVIVRKYTNRNPILPEHYAIFNNTINGIVVNLTDLSELERDDIPQDDNNGTDNGTNGTGNSSDDPGVDIPDNPNRLPSSIEILSNNLTRFEYLDIYLKDSNGNPISGAQIKFYFFDRIYNRTTDSSGKASLQFNAVPDNYTLNISFIGNEDYLPSNVSTKVYLNPIDYHVTDSNFYDFFDDDGFIKSDYAYGNLIFSGEFRNKRIILSSPANIISDNAVLYDSIVKIESNKAVVDGLTIINSRAKNKDDNIRFAILMDNVENCRVVNNNIKVDSLDNGYGIYVSESRNNQIIDNTVDVRAKALTFGIMLYDSSNNFIQNNDLKINGTDNPHQYESTIKVDTSISVDDYEAEGMVIPEVYKTYGIILFYSSNNDIGNNTIKATSGLTKYYTAVRESTNSIVAIDLYYDSNFNNVHHNNVMVSAKDPYIYGLGVLGAETGKRDQFATNNSFTDNFVFLNGTYYTAGIIAGYNSINTTMDRNYIIAFSNNVSYGVILEGAIRTEVDSNHIISRSRINYVLEGYDTDYNVISNNTLNAYGQYVGDVSLYNSDYNTIVRNSLSPINRENKADSNEYPSIDLDKLFRERLNIDNPLPNQPVDIEYDILRDSDLTEHRDVIPAHNSPYYVIGGKGNVFENNTIPDEPSNGGEGQNGGSGDASGNGGSGNSNGNSNANANTNGGGNSDGNNDGNNSTSANASNSNVKTNSSSSQSQIKGSGSSLESEIAEGNSVGTSSSSPVSEAANAYLLDVDEDPASARSLSFGGMNIPILCILFLLIFACASELVKRSKRDLK